MAMSKNPTIIKFFVALIISAALFSCHSASAAVVSDQIISIPGVTCCDILDKQIHPASHSATVVAFIRSAIFDLTAPISLAMALAAMSVIIVVPKWCWLWLRRCYGNAEIWNYFILLFSGGVLHGKVF
ncbi:MAG: hypothetical protein A3J93_02635 [Candidatus Magasanikbacteria bacterium RIFOXYC2_FULL_42_28]|uniref:Uncharacterized protein n=1 Tax=Candidatus Magasanikbacteria bacterium RIFOXYC2_FULL_42_28 TaxID=1798704 RepID=A0A1F6NVU1_9BACT|nr:MAG: hypothetical protein A3J93_02635 [Candidatus Magasanikbacteria bacterium RIFOXYC2_FULL_42_28]